ncbi:hypothetical protein W97_08078 [Coniosporium apollinis CBS 100218]|uniref:Ubiquitin 3 binding protein But2 C-terminal domain-containing protein n=1 Tax=Coniosporium apollinis (strain CBS 100218) TaxID=1168221 RepID=R7Z3P3_CONA1|nr:uncharacterized protein W97_08078 [Coniosporium apollinis CBS 100218]EON68820.1 hypothetical protein W97_08078 [Coniosporium apollinis CBS 100218]
MKSTIFISILLLAVSVLSAPAATRVFLPRSDLNRTAAFTSSPTETIAPSLQVRWKSRDGSKFASNDRGGHLLNNPNEKVHTAVYFNLSSEQARLGKTCRLVFRLSMDDWAISQSPVTPPQFDLYRLNGCLNDKYSWNNKVLRGAHAGILTPVKGAAAD